MYAAEWLRQGEEGAPDLDRAVRARDGRASAFAALSPAERRDALHALGRFLRRLHDADVSHRDLKAPNLVARRDGRLVSFAIVDLEGARVRRRGVSWRRRARDLARLDASLAHDVVSQRRPARACGAATSPRAGGRRSTSARSRGGSRRPATESVRRPGCRDEGLPSAPALHGEAPRPAGRGARRGGPRRRAQHGHVRHGAPVLPRALRRGVEGEARGRPMVGGGHRVDPGHRRRGQGSAAARFPRPARRPDDGQGPRALPPGRVDRRADPPHGARRRRGGVRAGARPADRLLRGARDHGLGDALHDGRRFPLGGARRRARQARAGAAQGRRDGRGRARDRRPTHADHAAGVPRDLRDDRLPRAAHPAPGEGRARGTERDDGRRVRVAPGAARRCRRSAARAPRPCASGPPPPGCTRRTGG